jgi:hypothetical protein
MSLDAVIMLVGALVAVIPFLGFPVSWDTMLFFALGIITIGLGIVVRRQRGEWETQMRKSMPQKVSIPQTQDIPEMSETVTSGEVA